MTRANLTAPTEPRPAFTVRRMALAFAVPLVAFAVLLALLLTASWLLAVVSGVVGGSFYALIVKSAPVQGWMRRRSQRMRVQSLTTTREQVERIHEHVERIQIEDVHGYFPDTPALWALALDFAERFEKSTALRDGVGTPRDSRDKPPARQLSPNRSPNDGGHDTASLLDELETWIHDQTLEDNEKRVAGLDTIERTLRAHRRELLTRLDSGSDDTLNEAVVRGREIHSALSELFSQGVAAAGCSADSVAEVDTEFDCGHQAEVDRFGEVRQLVRSE